jgi:hypothetical protein
VRREHGKRPPVEARTNWDPWLPATEAYPDIPMPLRIGALFAFVAVSFLFLWMVVMLFTM